MTDRSLREKSSHSDHLWLGVSIVIHKQSKSFEECGEVSILSFIVRIIEDLLLMSDSGTK
jgi:hypothetical protein